MLCVDVAASIGHAIYLAEQMAEAFVALRLRDSLPLDFSELMQRSFRQLGVLNSPAIVGIWQNISSTTNNWQQLDNHRVIGPQLWDFTECLRCELLGVSVDHAHVFGVTLSVNMAGWLMARHGDEPDWVTAIREDITSGDNFTPECVACFFREPMRSRLIEMEEVVAESKGQEVELTSRLVTAIVWCQGKFHDYLKPTYRQTDINTDRADVSRNGETRCNCM